jgi:hypothetical protein
MSDGACLLPCHAEPLSPPTLEARLRETQRLLARFHGLAPCDLHRLAMYLSSIADYLDAMADRAERDMLGNSPA